MARGKKAAATLTPEEKLQQALVPVEDQPYEIPTNWNWVRFDRATINYDSKRIPLSIKQRSALEKIYDYYGASGVIDKVDNYIFDQELLLIGEDGANLLSRSTPIAFLASGKYWVNNHAHILDSSAITTRTFLCNYINSIDLAPYVTGSAQPKLTQDKMNAIPVPIPPLAEQQRIVERIESIFAKLDEAKEKARAVVDGFELRKSAILHKAFTGELTARWRQEHTKQLGDIDLSALDKNYEIADYKYGIPDNWKWVLFNECCTFVGSGVTPKGGREVYQNDGIPFIRSQNVLKGELDLSEVAYISDEINNQMKRTQINGGETLFNITGASIGRSCFVPFDQNIGNVNQHVCIIRFKNYILPQLPQLWMNSPIIQRFVVENQIGQTRQALNFKQIRGMWFPVAPIEEQQEIIRALNDLLDKEQYAKDVAQAVVDQIDTMKKAVLARAFRGELGTNDPNEESVIELLKTIL